MKRALNEYQARFKKYFNAGLASGKLQLLWSLDSLMDDPSRLQQLAPGTDLTDIMATARKRRDFLTGQV
jgi:hypothetical protein